MSSQNTALKVCYCLFFFGLFFNLPLLGKGEQQEAEELEEKKRYSISLSNSDKTGYLEVETVSDRLLVAFFCSDAVSREASRYQSK